MPLERLGKFESVVDRKIITGILTLEQTRLVPYSGEKEKQALQETVVKTIAVQLLDLNNDQELSQDPEAEILNQESIGLYALRAHNVVSGKHFLNVTVSTDNQFLEIFNRLQQPTPTESVR